NGASSALRAPSEPFKKGGTPNIATSARSTTAYPRPTGLGACCGTGVECSISRGALMTLFAELIREVQERKTLLSTTLLKAKDLSHRLKNETMLEWINTELKGYRRDGTIPVYRIHPVSLTGVYQDPTCPFPSYATKGRGIPLWQLSPELRDFF